MGVEIRPAEPADSDDIYRIYIESWNEGFGYLAGRREFDEHGPARWASTLAEGETRWWVAEAESGIVGFVGVGPSRDPIEEGLGEVDTIAVDPTHWRSGVGRALMHRAADAMAGEYREAILWTAAEYERRHGFYRATGWARDNGSRNSGAHVSFRRRL